MNGFLYEVAEDLYSRYGQEVGELNILFPSRRARLFFTDALSRIANAPIWEPNWVTIDDLMSRISGIEVGDRVRLIAELYNVYKIYHPEESFDRFYFWGEILLADFDMVDKYRIDADMLFHNVADIKELESDLSYLTPEQLQIIKAFWSTIGAEEDLSLHKKRFLAIWRSLRPIYHQYRERLTQLGLAYSGMVHRKAADKLRANKAEFKETDRYVIAGFNALSECEKILFETIKNSCTTHFFWDWDNYYVENRDQEAGLFIASNRLRFPSDRSTTHDNFAKHKQMEVVACSSSALQCKYVATILNQIRQKGGAIDKNTAIVLTDESLLLPLLYALPPDVGKVNVTMGYPLRSSLAYSFVERLLELQHHAHRSKSSGEVTLYHIDVMGILSHPYLDGTVDSTKITKKIKNERLIRVPATMLHQTPLLTQIFSVAKSWREVSNYLIEIIKLVATLPNNSEDDEQRVEFLTLLADQISTLHNSVEHCGIELNTSTYVSLLRRHLQPLRIPFEGEPLEGLQVMGILETRSLDFENVIILSMNDDNFPSNRTMQPSYIPYNLRAAYELPTPEHHDGVFAYYFYRLIQRSSKLWMLYCSRADDKSTGEQSRYITQLDYESPYKLHRRNVGVDVNVFDGDEITINKNDEKIAAQLQQFCTEQQTKEGEMEIKKLSPTALFQYVVCPLKFYFRSLAHIKVGDELSEEVDAPMFGNILHHAMQYLYEPYIGASNIGELIQSITLDKIKTIVDRAIEDQYLKGGDKSNYSGNLMLVREVVVNYIKGGILKYDAAHPDFMIQSVESPIEHFIDLEGGGRIRLWGICDRIDSLNSGAIRIVDYKSGTPHLEFAGLEALFYGKAAQRQSNIFQTLLYSYVTRQQSSNGVTITPSLYYVRSMNNDDYSPLIVDQSTKNAVESYEDLHSDFETLLRATLYELFDTSIPFKQCDDKESCKYCDYDSICKRR